MYTYIFFFYFYHVVFFWGGEFGRQFTVRIGSDKPKKTSISLGKTAEKNSKGGCLLRCAFASQSQSIKSASQVCGERQSRSNPSAGDPQGPQLYKRPH